MKKNLFGTMALMCMVLTAVPTFAITKAVNTNTVSPTLTVNVFVQDAIQLTLSTGSQCAVNAPGPTTDYKMDFGTVDALGITAVTCGLKYAPTTPGVTPSVYYSDYKLTPVFTSQAFATNTVKAYVSGFFTKSNLSIVQSNTTPAVIGDLTAMSTNPAFGSQTLIATNAVSGTPITAYIGVSVAPTNGASLTGTDFAIITYTLTVQ